MDTLEALMAECAEWADATFGQANPTSIAEHLRREAHELKANPFDREEMADVLMCLAHLIHQTGTDITFELRRKLEINRKRQWGKPDADGVVEHIR